MIGSLSVCIIVHVQKQLNTSVPVIAVGGSYGGMYKLLLNIIYCTMSWYCGYTTRPFQDKHFFLGFIMRFKDSIKKYSKFYISSTIIYIL